MRSKVITSEETDNWTVNQSKLEADTYSWHEARENVCESVTIGFSFTIGLIILLLIIIIIINYSIILS